MIESYLGYFCTGEQVKVEESVEKLAGKALLRKKLFVPFYLSTSNMLKQLRIFPPSFTYKLSIHIHYLGACWRIEG